MKALTRFEISWISNLTAVRLELTVLLSFEKGWSKFRWCAASGGAPLPGVGTYINYNQNDWVKYLLIV